MRNRQNAAEIMVVLLYNVEGVLKTTLHLLHDTALEEHANDPAPLSLMADLFEAASTDGDLPADPTRRFTSGSWSYQLHKHQDLRFDSDGGNGHWRCALRLEDNHAKPYFWEHTTESRRNRVVTQADSDPTKPVQNLAFANPSV